MSKRTLFLIFALIIITFVLLMIAIYQPQSPKVTQKITPTPIEAVEQTVLSFGSPVISTSSSALRQSADLSYSLPVNITTGKNKVTAVQLELQFDPLLLSNITITPSSFFTNPIVLLNQIDYKTGRISYAFGIGPTEQGIAGQGTVANLTFSVKAGAPERTAIIFLPKTLVTAEGITKSVLKEAGVGQFTLRVKDSTSSAAKSQ